MRAPLWLVILPALIVASPTRADWPTWRADEHRSAVAGTTLTEQIHLQWTRQYHPLTPAWAEDPRLHFDAVYEPIVLGKTMFVASSRRDSVVAIDTENGKEQWRFFTGGPVRFAPVGHKDHIYFGSDDGHVYCLKAKDGTVAWKHRALPSARKVIGNDRLIPVWPVRGGPVLKDNKLSFTIGVWPFEGTFLMTLDAKNGQLLTDESGLQGRMALKDVTPQGYLVATDARLYLPGGRAKVTVFDRATGKPISHRADSRGKTDYHVAALGRWMFHGDRIHAMDKKLTLPVVAERPVITAETVYAGAAGKAVAYNLKEPTTITKKDRKGKKTTVMSLATRWALPVNAIQKAPTNPKLLKTWLAANPLRIDLKAGNRLYGHQGKIIFAISLPKGEAKAAVAWKQTLKDTPASMVAAHGKLYVITKEGAIHCYGEKKIEPQVWPASKVQFTDSKDQATAKAASLLQQSGKSGYALVLGLSDGRLIEELARQSSLRIIGLDSDEDKVQALRKRMDENGLYGQRVHLLAGEMSDAGLPPYFANLITSETDTSLSKVKLQQAYHCLRPYGGVMAMTLADKPHADLAAMARELSLPHARMTRNAGVSVLTRSGSLPGSGNWTHEYGDGSNTLFAEDKLVKAPLGMLWWGGPAASGKLFFDRHLWGPSMAVIDGRMFIQGPGVFTAVDVYTGRILWQTKVPKRNALGRVGNFATTGFHFVALNDSIYLNDAQTIFRIDPATGKKLAEIKPPADSEGWGRIRVWRDYLLITVFHKTGKRESRPTELVALNRKSGKQIWSKKAHLGFPLFATGSRFLYAFDGAMPGFYNSWKRKGKIPKALAAKSVLALDLRTGKTLWSEKTDQVVTWLSVSPKHNVLISSNKDGIVARRGDTGSTLWEKKAVGKGFKGHPESVWDKVILWKDRVIDQRGPGLAYNIETGKTILRKHPVSGKMVPWQFTKEGHHCNYAIANEHMLTFRAADAGFCDLNSTNTTRLKGFRSGCRNSLIPANGVLNAPNFAHGCVCGYSLFTSMAFVHLPKAEVWAYSAIATPKDTVKRIGINFGAPGDRLASNGTLWIEHPSVGGRSPGVKVDFLARNRRWFRLLAEQIEGDGPAWVAGSGLEGIVDATVSIKGTSAAKPGTCTVRLYFMEPYKQSSGDRVFGISLQGKSVLKNLDVLKEAGGLRRVLMKEFKGVRVDGKLKVSFDSQTDKPILSGIEVILD